MITASIIGQTFITIMLDSKTMTINDDHVNYSAIREALRLKDHDQVEKLINVKASLINFVQGSVRIENEKVFYGDMEVGGPVVERILAMVRENFDSQPMMRFLANLLENPSRRAVNELYGFLEESELPITEDGCFLAYKKVREDYKDFYSGKYDNTPNTGIPIREPRNQVDDEKENLCSKGLHFCSLSYLPHYHGGHGKVVIVKIDPRDVVSIPTDYNNAKGRCCEYIVVGEHTSGEDTYAFTSPVYRDADPMYPDIDPTLDDGNQGDDDYDTDFDKGYKAGEEAGNADTDAKLSFNDTLDVDGDVSDVYKDGYAAGYGDNYTVDWMQEGYDEGDTAAQNNDTYNDEPAAALNADEATQYKEGYADGWRDAKVQNLYD